MNSITDLLDLEDGDLCMSFILHFHLSVNGNNFAYILIHSPLNRLWVHIMDLTIQSAFRAQ